MNPGPIELTTEEKAILVRIKLEASSLGEYPDALENGQAVSELMASLIDRKAIPDTRRKFFLDPDYYPGGRGRSRKDNFERNGTRGKEIFEHPHFLPYLRYFLYGAQLPAEVIAAFTAELSDRGMITSSDVVPLGKFARQQARLARLPGHEAAEEFYKLAIDCGLSHYNASHIRDAVKRLR